MTSNQCLLPRVEVQVKAKKKLVLKCCSYAVLRFTAKVEAQAEVEEICSE